MFPASSLAPSGLLAPLLPWRPVAVLVATAALALPAAAVTPFTIADIRIDGLQRTDPGTVFAALPFRIGDSYNDEKGAAALRALFATGLFNDVRVEIQGEVVVVVVDERPVIAAISFIGLHEFDKDPLTKALRDSGIGEGQPFDKAVIDRAEQELKRQYLTRSLYGAEVSTTVTPLERNRVNVAFTINEGGAAKINEIRIVGATAFSEGRLLDLFELTTSGWLTWYTKSDRYSRTALNGDLEKLAAFYRDQGYMEFAVESTQVAISPDKRDISIAISVKEGQRYTVTGVKLEGDYLGKEELFREYVLLKPGEPYSGSLVEHTIKLFTNLFGTYGYAFAQIEQRPVIDRAAGQVQIVLVANPQRRVYVRRIEVAGNSRTRDEVIRREFRQFESAWYDATRVELSKARLNRLDYFDEVEVETHELPGLPDQVDLTVTVKEKSTGNLMLGVGYSNAEKLALSGSIRQDNIFGSGQYLGLEVNTAKSYRTLVLSALDPYMTADGVSRAIDVYYRTQRPFNSLGDEYDLTTAGASVRFGIPFSEADTVFLGIGGESTRIGASVGIPLAYLNHRVIFGANSTAFPITLGWQSDSRDSVASPSRGRYERVNAEVSAVGDVRYLRANLQYQEFWSLPWRFTLGFNSELGWGEGLGGKPFPVFKNFYGGGLGSVRAFEQNSLGVVDPTGAYVGGAKSLNINTNLYIPLPGVKEKSLRVFGFFDAGNVWRDDERVELGSLRTSVGIGLSWISPMGPLQLSYGVPVKVYRNDRIQRFQFQIGTSF